MEEISKNLLAIRQSIAHTEKKYGRAPGAVTLVAVSKAQNSEKIRAAVGCGQKHFGENYLKEALDKITEFKTCNIIWHYLGRIQTKKAKLIAPNFAWVESVASYEIAELLNKHRPINAPLLQVCIQVNISQEESKAGILAADTLDLARKINQLPKLKLRGLMAIPRQQKGFAEQLAAFQLLALELKKLQQHGISVDTLSMGMSEDYEAAIAAGSTLVRVGTAILGKRN